MSKAKTYFAWTDGRPVTCVKYIIRGVPRILPGGMHIFGWIWIRIRIRIKILSWIRIRIRIKTMRIHSPGLYCQKIVV